MTATATMHLRAEAAPFVMLPRWLLRHDEVSDGAKVLYCVLHDLVAGREGPTRPVTRMELAGVCGVSANTVDRRLAELLAAGAVDKEPQILTTGQVGNVYRVWLSPPEQRRVRVPTGGEARSGRVLGIGEPEADTASEAVDNGVPSGGEAGTSRFPNRGEGDRRWGGTLPTDRDANVFEEEKQEIPPQPPRTAGGHDEQRDNADHTTATGSRRAEGTNLRAKGAHPRAAEQFAAAEQERQRAARAEADLEARTAARLAEDEAGAAARAAFEAEGLVVSAALDDDRLTRIVETVRATLTGPLATSALTVTRAVIDWCRAASAQVPALTPVPAAVDAALATPLFANPEPTAPPLPAADVPPDTVPLRRRVATLLSASVEVP